MPGNISRGNPRSSSVGEEEDVEEVRYRSTSELDASQIVDIEDCGIPLDCTSAGDSFGAQDPCDNLDLSIYNVMGQEDKFRQENGSRVNRGGTGRIVVSTEDPSTIESIEYTRNPADEDNPPLNSTWNPTTILSKYHEVFVPLSPVSLYAFRVNINHPDCPDTNTSGIYYISTGDEVVVTARKLDADPGTVVFSSYKNIQKSILEGVQTSIGQPSPTLLSMESENTVSVISSSSISSLSKSVSISMTFTTS